MRDPCSSPGRGSGGKYSHWAGRLGHTRPRGDNRIKATRWSGAAGGSSSQAPTLSPPSSGVLHTGDKLTTSTATFSFSTERPFRGAVTATPSSSAFLRSSSISWAQTCRAEKCQGPCPPAGFPQPPEFLLQLVPAPPSKTLAKKAGPVPHRLSGPIPLPCQDLSRGPSVSKEQRPPQSTGPSIPPPMLPGPDSLLPSLPYCSVSRTHRLRPASWPSHQLSPLPGTFP